MGKFKLNAIRSLLEKIRKLLRKVTSRKRSSGEFEFNESIYHLNFICNVVKSYYDFYTSEIEKNDGCDNPILSFLVQSMVIMHLNAFLDEYDRHFKSSNPDISLAVKNCKKIAKPFVRTLREWKELKKFRNEVVAHNMRNGFNGASILSELHSYDAPNSIFDLLIVSECLVSIIDVLKGFEDRISIYQEYLDGRPQKKLKPRYTSLTQVREKMKELTVEANKTILKLKENLKYR